MNELGKIDQLLGDPNSAWLGRLAGRLTSAFTPDQIRECDQKDWRGPLTTDGLPYLGNADDLGKIPQARKD
ncbi:MAG TPA: hypothetical protein VLL54_02275 [Pyrinomonadaceae bacterium]|nr:hypothetical protein [Pyrinomonadaceae bacterium]